MATVRVAVPLQRPDLEALGESLPAGALVVARIARKRGHLVGEPLSLVLLIYAR